MPSAVTCLLTDENGKILILKRSNKVRTYKGCWSNVAGYVEKDEKPIETAFKEIREEIGLEADDVEFICKAEPIEFTDVYEDVKYDWKIFPFLFKTLKKDKIQIDWEHIEYRWINPSEIKNYNTPPHFKDVMSKLLKM